MAELPIAAKVRLITLLAQFTGPSEAARIVSDEFGVTLARAQAWKYDASKRGCTAGPRYRQLFAEVRERWLNDLASIGIAKQGHRLRVLDRLAARLEERGDYMGAARVLEQAAKEVGGRYSGKADAKSPSSLVHPRQAFDDRAREQLVARFASLAERFASGGGDAASPS